MKTKVQNKIRELVPELMDLSFGCKYVAQLRNIKTGEILEGATGQDKVIGWKNGDTFINSCLAEIKEQDIIKIIGHPIHLEHVLRAIELCPSDEFFDGVPCITEDGEFADIYGVDSGVIDKPTYNLSKPFSEQSPELYQFLAEILL